MSTRSASPPSYASIPPNASSYPQPNSRIQPPSFRQRKSSTIISISQTPSPSTSPLKHLPTLSQSPTPPALDRRLSNESSNAEEGEATPLLHPEQKVLKWYEGPLFVTGVKLAVLFFVFTGIVVGTFWFGMPPLDPEDKVVMKIPRSFADLQALNTLFQKYKREFPLRILACGVVSYLFVQTFSLPGSMYISILFGAAYGMLYGLLLSCLCESVGSVFCYTLSSLLAPPLLTMPFYRARVETWRTKIMGDSKKGKEVTWDGILAFLVVLRIAPFPPHWIANFVAPHLGIGVGLFWASCFIGIAPVSVIHVTIGSSLDSMTSAEDFHILSLRNILGLLAVVVAVLIPVGLKKVFRKDLGELGEAEEVFGGIETVQVREVEVEVEGMGEGRRYRAVDSGVVLAGPSVGSEDIHPDYEDGSGVKGKGKGKGREITIIADIREAIEDEQGEYEIYEPDGRVESVVVEKIGRGRGRGREKAPRGYGAINEEEVVVGREAMEGRGDGAGVWWGFSR